MTTSPKDALELAKDYQSHGELAHNEPNLLILSDALISAHEKLEKAKHALKHECCCPDLDFGFVRCNACEALKEIENG